MAIIFPCRLTPTAYANAGRDVEVPDLRCPRCERRLTGWGGGLRAVRYQHERLRVWLPRRRCPSCRKTHRLLPSWMLERRVDVVTTIGAAVGLAVGGVGPRRAAEAVGVPETTVRDWCRRFSHQAPAMSAGLVAWTVAEGGTPVWEVATDVVRATVTDLGAAWSTALRRFQELTPPPWEFWNLITGGTGLGTNTRPLFPRFPEAARMAASVAGRSP